ncbi:MAG TPA: M48 family metalloprotease [Candidatus Acidoferrales bacterium]|nr:M48 family metalloprotease [Candidatus Acidoferrales bacterium]
MKKIYRRSIAIAMLASLVMTSAPLPAGAVSTAEEIRIGEEAARQVDQENPILTDPILQNWVNTIGGNLAQYRARPDIHYTFKIIDTNDINSFSIPGGFIYVNYGLLNFVNSDDELAGVLGHEIGHTERRNQITLNAKAQILNVVLGVLSFISPFIWRFGGLINGLSVEKMSRIDELQADQYGLMLMTRAGYDPNAMVSFMERLGNEDAAEGNDLLNKYFEDHPESPDRVAHLRGYPELSQQTPEQMVDEAIHDQDEGRYAYAQHKLDLVLAKEPDNQLALLHEGQIDVALGDYSEGELALGKVAHASSLTPAAKTAVQEEMALLPEAETPGDKLLDPDVTPLINQLNTALAATKTTQASLDDHIKLGRDDLTRFNNRLQNMLYEVPDFSQVDIEPGSRLDGVQTDLAHMAKDINIVEDKADALMLNSPGMLKDDFSVLNEMNAPLHRKAMTATDLELLPFYPDLITQIGQSQTDLISGVTSARGAVALAWQAIPLLDSYFRELDRAQLDFGGDISPSTAQQLKPLAVKAEVALDGAAAAAEIAQSSFFNAQARQLISSVTMLGVGVSEPRYETLAHVISNRLGVDPPTYDETVRLGLSAGDITAATWLAAEEKVPVSTVINEERATGKSVIDMAVAKGYSQESLEIVLGVIYEGYTEKPLD